jgi:hypothetical protein
VKQDYVFTDQQVHIFCKATKDFNPVHNPLYMQSKGKRVVVPGMLLFSKVATMLFGAVGTSLNSYRILINSIVSTNEEIILGFEDGPNGDRYIFAINHQDSFSHKDERSRVYQRESEKAFCNDGNYWPLPIDNWQLQDFGEVIGCNNIILRDFLFGIAYASNALFKCIDNPVTEVEREINILLDKTKNPSQVSPFYQSLEIFLPNNPIPLVPSGKIDYLIHYEREKKDRVYVAYVRCEQDGQVLYHSEYKLVAIPDRLILRMARDM